MSDQEVTRLRCQFGTSNKGRGGRRYHPYAFTEQGVAMLSSVIQSREAVAVNIEIVRAFVQMREITSIGASVSKKLNQLEEKLGKHDNEIPSLFEAIKQLITPSKSTSKRRIGF